MYYAGIDAHLSYLQIAVVDRAGAIKLNHRVSTRKPEELVRTLAPFHPLEVVVETCPFWPWIYDLLVPEGVTFHLAHAKELRFIANTPQKKDAVDAALLARMLLSGLIPKAYPRRPEQRETLRLIRHRAALVRERTRLACRIHSQLHQSRVLLEREALLRKRAREFLATEAGSRLTPEQWALISSHFDLIDRITLLINQLDRRIEERGQCDRNAQLLMTIPGIGPYRGLLLATEISPVERFPRPAELVSYAGLAPTTRSSGGHTRHGEIPRGANRWVRGALVSAIPSHVRLAPESALSSTYETLRQRLGWQVARVAAARKLARIVYRMLQTGERWRE
ncbi:MAG: IS110 family transposase [Gemmatimonadota bacterium]|nr:MAG: IS110 family transposase [Gemmatimonadota bacterium]